MKKYSLVYDLILIIMVLSTLAFFNSLPSSAVGLISHNTIQNNQVKDSSLHNQNAVHSVHSLKTNTPIKGFISTWITSVTNQIKLPLQSNGNYDFNVTWGDGTNSTITMYNQAEVTHTYSSYGTYTLNITGTISGFRFNNAANAINLYQISNWGPLNLGNDGYYFAGALNLVITAKDSLNLNGTTNLAGMFEYCSSLGNSGNLNAWNVSQVTNMASMFNGNNYNPNFNQPLNSWNVSKVTDMNSMFYGNTYFNQPLDSWNVSQVTNMNSMFAYAPNFNQSLNSWDVSHVTNMNSMFPYATIFNQPLNSWNVSQVTDMAYMFNGAHSFDQSLSSWNVSKVTDLTYMLHGVTLSYENYDQLLEGWSSLTNLTQNVHFDAGNSQYNLSFLSARNILVKNYSWIITDKGIADATVPSAPLSLNASFETNKVVLVWDHPNSDGGSKITKYNIYRSFTNGTSYVLIGSTTNLNYTITSVLTNKTYFFVVTAFNVVGESTNSNQTSITIPIITTTSTTVSSNTLSSTNTPNNKTPTSPRTSTFGSSVIIFLSIIFLVFRKKRLE